jgi:hypothetical protein
MFKSFLPILITVLLLVISFSFDFKIDVSHPLIFVVGLCRLRICFMTLCYNKYLAVSFISAVGILFFHRECNTNRSVPYHLTTYCRAQIKNLISP